MSSVRALPPKARRSISSSTCRTTPERPGDPAGGLDLDGVPLAVADGQGERLEPGRLRLGQRRGRVEPAAQEHDRRGIGFIAHPLSGPKGPDSDARGPARRILSCRFNRSSAILVNYTGIDNRATGPNDCARALLARNGPVDSSPKWI